MVGPPIVEVKAPPAEDRQRLRARGRVLFQDRCAGCHGKDGDGRGPFAPGLSVQPTNLTLGIYKLRSTPTGSIPTDEDLFRSVTRGIHGTPMLPWKELSAEDRWALVDQLKAFSMRFRQERPLPPIRIPVPPKEDGALRSKGTKLYGLLRCGACHGDQGKGNGPAEPSYQGRAVRIRDFSRGRFIRGTEMEDIYLTLRVGIEGTPMGAYDALRDDELWALAAHVRLLIRERPVYEFPPARTHARLP